MFGSSLAPKWSKPVPFCGMDHQKSIFLLISDTLSVRGCWGQPMLLFWKLVDETQISKPLEATRHHISTILLVFLPLRSDLLCTLHYETPCTVTFRFPISKKNSFRGNYMRKYGMLFSPVTNLMHHHLVQLRDRYRYISKDLVQLLGH